jgi:hypothetical protein
MHIEVDQSGRIEYTQQDTVLAFADGECYSVLITAKTKRMCIDKLRSKDVKPPRLQAILFATAVFLLLKRHARKIDAVTIDREYYGNEPLIKGHLLNLLTRAGIPFDANAVRFDLIGKKSPAHAIAISTFRRNRRPDRVISENEILDEL